MAELHSMHGLALFGAAVAGLAIAHRAVLYLPTGLPRLIFILPILPIFFMLPWIIPIYHFRAILSFIFLWTVPSKLLLLCWDAGIDYPSSGFLYFATMVMLPIRVRGKKVQSQVHGAAHKGQLWWQLIAVIIILNIYSYRNGLPIWAIYVLYTCHMYLGLELMLGGLAKLATACFGVESDPQFNNPFMSASLSEFWGRRWNIIVTTILRSTVYNPALVLLMKAEKQKAHHVKKPRTSSSTILGSGALWAHMPSLCSQKEAYPVAGQDNRSTHSEDSGTMTDMVTSESDGTNLSCTTQESTVAGFQIDDHEWSSPLPCHAIHAEQEMEHMNQSSPPFTMLLHPDHTPKPSSKLAPMERAVGNDDTDITPIQPGATTTSTTSSIEHSAMDPNRVCNRQQNPDVSARNPNPSPQQDDATPKPPQSAECLVINTPVPVRTNKHPDPPRYPDYELYTPVVRNGLIQGGQKPSLRARAAAMLRARAAAMLANSNKDLDDLRLRSNEPARSTPDPSHGPELSPAVCETEAQEGSTDKPSLRARALAMLVTFAVSGLVHELIFYYINKSRATGEVTAFFLLHGCATAVEVLLKKTLLSQVHLPRPISIALTLAFLYTTAAWLFMPPLTRYNADINTIAEYQRLQSALVGLFTHTHRDG